MLRCTKIVAALGTATALGFASLPLGGAFADTVTISVSIAANTTMTITGVEGARVTAKGSNTTGITYNSTTADSDTKALTMDSAGKGKTTISQTVASSSNNTKGYKINLKASSTNLSNGTTDIAAATSCSSGTSAWVVRGGGSNTVFDSNKISTSDQIFTNITSLTANTSRTDTAYYDVCLAGTETAGTYTATLTYTLVNNT